MSSVLRYIQKRELGSKFREDKIFVREKLATDKHLHKKDLLAHFGCVNAVEFSGEGSLLVSGGDDRRVLLWQVDKAITDNVKYNPVAMEAEHRSNIFCLGFDSDNTRIYSGGNDEQVIVHDMITKKPLDSGLGTSQGSSDGPSSEQVLVNINSDDQRAEVRHFSAETQTPPQSSQNLIADLIAKKRAHLVRRAKRRASKSEGDSKIENKIIQSARRMIRSDSGSSTQSGSSSVGTETDVTPISSPVLDWASASSPLSEPGPSTSSPRVTNSPLLQNLKRKRMKLLANHSDSDSEEEIEIPTRSSVEPQGTTMPAGANSITTSSSASLNPNPSSLPSQSCHTSQTQFRMKSKKEDRNIRKRLSEQSDSED